MSTCMCVRVSSRHSGKVGGQSGVFVMLGGGGGGRCEPPCRQKRGLIMYFFKSQGGALRIQGGVNAPPPLNETLCVSICMLHAFSYSI